MTGNEMAEQSNDRQPPEKGKKRVGPFGQVAPYLGLGLQLAVTVVVFFYIGKWLDDRYDTKPYLMLAGSMVGMAGGFIKFYKTVNELSKNEDQH